MSNTKGKIIKDDLYREWVQNAVVWQQDFQLSESAWLRQNPLLVIGLGTAGKTVLDNVVNYLQGRFGVYWSSTAKHIRLLSINVSGEMIDEYMGIQYQDGYPSITLVLDREQRNRKLSWHPGMEWFSRERIARPNRALGRLAVFSNLAEGKAGSQLWSAIQSSIGSYKNISVILVGDSFSYETSSIIADIAHLVRICNPGQITRVSLFLALQNAHWDDDLRPGQRNESTFATIRELQRLQTKSEIQWHYAPGLGQRELMSNDEGPLFDEIFFFDGLGEDNVDLSELSANIGILSAITECVIALLDNNTSQRFYDIGANQASEPVRSGEVRFEDVVGSMGCYVLRLPVDEIRQILDLHLLHKYLFDHETGVIPCFTIEKDHSVSRNATINAIRAGDIDEFIDLRGISSLEHTSVSEKDAIQHIAIYLEYRLNQWPSGHLRWAIRFLDELEQKMPAWKSAITSVRDAINDWLSTVIEAQQVAPAQSSMLSSVLGVKADQPKIKKSQKMGPLYELWQEEWVKSRTALNNYNKLHTHHSFWNLDDEPRLYKKFVSSEKLWERMRTRTWWRFTTSSEFLELGIVLLPADLTQPDPQHPYQTLRDTFIKTPMAYALFAKDEKIVFNKLLDLAHTTTQKFSIENNIQEYLKNNESKYAQDLFWKSLPLCRRRYLAMDKKVWPIPVEPHFYYTGPDETAVREIAALVKQSQMGEERDSHRFVNVISTDNSECRLLHVKHILPIQSTDAYARARNSYSYNPDLHVFIPEKISAVWEKLGSEYISPSVYERKIQEGGKGITFSPYMAELISKNQNAMRSFGAGLVYMVIKFDPFNHQIADVASDFDDAENLVGLHIYNAMEYFFNKLMIRKEFVENYRRTISERKPEEYGQKIAFFDDLREKVIYPLSIQKNPVAQDIALLMGTILAKEEQAGI